MAIRVYIDQGHNPMSPNTGAEGNGLREQDITYEVGRLLYERMRRDPNYVVELSRPTPETQLGASNAGSLRARVAGAEAFGADLFLSIHTNAAENAAANGSEADITVVLDIGYHKAYLVHMGAEHKLLALSLFMADEISHAVSSDSIEIGLHFFGDICGELFLVS